MDLMSNGINEPKAWNNIAEKNKVDNHTISHGPNRSEKKIKNNLRIGHTFSNTDILYLKIKNLIVSFADVS